MRVRKAWTAAAGAAIAVVATGLQAGTPTSVEGWAGLAGGALVAAIIAGYATWRIPNAQ